MIDKLGGRKTLALLIVLIAGTAFTVINKDMPLQYAQFLEIMFGLYVGGNVGSKVLFKPNSVEKLAEPTHKPIEVHKPVEAHKDYTATLEQLGNSLATVQHTLQFIITKTGIDKMP